jgi:hypothetical protein
MNTKTLENDAEQFIDDVKKFNANVNNPELSETNQNENLFENPLDDDFNDNDFEDEKENGTEKISIKEKELRDGIKKIIDGATIVKVVDSVFPNTILYLLSFVDKDFNKIDVEKIKLTEDEIEIYKPIGDYVSEYILNNINPVLLLGGLYLYRTTLAITIEYNKIKENKHLKHKPMPIKKNKTEKKDNQEKLKNVKSFYQKNEYEEKEPIIDKNESYINNLENELLNKNSEIEKLNNAINELRKEFLNATQKFDNPIQSSEVNNSKIDKRKIVDDERKKILIERIKKAREAKLKKIKENKTSEDNDKISE